MRAASVLCLVTAVAHAMVISPARRFPAVEMVASSPEAADLLKSLASTYNVHDAAASGDANAVDLLLTTGLSTADDRNQYGSTPLHIAVVNGHEDIVSLLLDKGASPNAANEDGNTPLHAAVGKGERQCAKLLLERGADAEITSNSGAKPLIVALQKQDAAMLSTLLDGGVQLDEETVQHVFFLAVAMAEATPQDGTLSEEVPPLLHHVFDADMEQLITRQKSVTNVTCMQPVTVGSGYEVINDDLLAVPLTEGRACDGGDCCVECSRVNLPTFASHREADIFIEELQQVIVPPLHQFSLQKCAFRDMRTTLIFVRLVERMRRAIAHEYGLSLATVTPLQTFVSCFIGAQDKQGGLHSDESTFAEFHYSCVAYLSSQGEDFEGGTFYWNDNKDGARVETAIAPTKGMANIFSSGWENMHEVQPLISGTRFAVPTFFTTNPQEVVKEIASNGPVGSEAVAEALWKCLLTVEEVSDFRRFMMNWHGLLAPGR